MKHRSSALAPLILLCFDFLSTTISMEITGHPDCPCIDASAALAASSNCYVDEEKTIPGIFQPRGGACYPLHYGSTQCDRHDMTLDPKCLAENPPSYCFNNWCYVDADKCRASKDRFYASPIAGGHFWSYSTCDSSSEGWFGAQTIEDLANKTLTVALNNVDYPLHYKKDQQGNIVDSFSPEVFDDSIPWQGLVVDYFNAVVEFSNIKDVKYFHRSGGSTTKGHGSIFTQSVSDVQAGTVDLAVASFWVTTERLAMTSFTAPVTTDDFKLWIPQPKMDEGSFSDNIHKILMPFSANLWWSIMGAILTFALLSVVVSPDHFRRDDKSAPTLRKKISQRFTLWTDALNVSFLEFMSGGVDYRAQANPAQKLLNLGFAFTIFITVTAYTANLAAFLTLSGAADFISTVEEANAQGVPICTLEAVKSELTNLYPTAPFVYRPNVDDLFEAFDTGRCGGFVFGWVDVRGAPHYVQKMCERNLVRVGETIMNKLVAFPAKEEVVAGLSHWLVEAESQGIHYDKFVIENEEPMCSLEIALATDDENSGLKKLTPTHMALPLTVFAGCCAVALVIHFLRLLCARSSNVELQSYCSATFGLAPLSSEAMEDPEFQCEIEPFAFSRSSRTIATAPTQRTSSTASLSSRNRGKKPPKCTHLRMSDSAEETMHQLQSVFAYQQKVLDRLECLSRADQRQVLDRVQGISSARGGKRQPTKDLGYPDLSECIDNVEC